MIEGLLQKYIIIDSGYCNGRSLQHKIIYIIILKRAQEPRIAMWNNNTHDKSWKLSMGLSSNLVNSQRWYHCKI